MIGYDYEIIYKGKENVAFDSPSRKYEWFTDPKIFILTQQLQHDYNISLN
jgi:hypothetical protein